MKFSTTKVLSVAATRAPSKRVSPESLVWYVGFKRTQSNSLEVFTRMKSLSGFEVFTRMKLLSGFEIFICLWSLYQFLKSLSVFEAFISFWSCNSCLFFKFLSVLKPVSIFEIFIRFESLYRGGGGGGTQLFFQVGVCGPDFRSVGLANWHLPLKRGLVSGKFPNLGACELKISKFGGLWAENFEIWGLVS